MKEHTPIPWSYNANDKLNPDRAFGIVRALGAKFDEEAGTDGATEVIAEVCIADGGQAEADSELICRAVNNHEKLVEALKEMVFRFDHNESPEDRAALDEARATITNATNKTP